MEKQELTPAEQKILTAIKASIAENGYSPSIRDICKLTGLKSTSGVHRYLCKLEKKGYMTRPELTARAIQITDKEDK